MRQPCLFAPPARFVVWLAVLGGLVIGRAGAVERLDPASLTQFPASGGKPAWVVEKDAFFDSRNGKEFGEGDYAVSGKAYRDGVFRFRVAEQSIWTRWGIVLRWQDEKNFIELRFNDQSKVYAVVKNGTRTEVPLPENWLYIPQMRPADIAVSLQGKQVRVYVEGAERLAFATESADAGRIGFFSYSPAVAVKIVQDSIAFDAPGSPITAVAIPVAVKSPYLYWNMGGEVRVAWETQVPAQAHAAEAKGKDGKTVQAEVVSTGVMHYATFKGLAAGTAYAYQCSSGKAKMGGGTFTVEPGAGKPTRFCLVGDNQYNPLKFAKTVAFMGEAKPDFVLNVGDKVERGLLSDWDTELFTPMAPLSASVPLFGAIGNHEEQSRYEAYFLPYPGRTLGCTYVLRYGCVGVLVIDGDAPHREVMAYVDKAMASPDYQKATWRLAMVHYPLYSVGCADSEGVKWKRDDYEAAFKKGGVDFFFTGHVHDYERGFKDGTYQVTSGGAAAGLDDYARPFRHVAVFRKGHNTCFFEASPERIEMQVKGLDTRELWDRVVITKKGKKGGLAAKPELVARAGGTPTTLPDQLKVKTAAKVKYRVFYGDTVDSYQWTDFYPAGAVADLKLSANRPATCTTVEVDAMDEDGNLSASPLVITAGAKNAHP